MRTWLCRVALVAAGLLWAACGCSGGSKNSNNNSTERSAASFGELSASASRADSGRVILASQDGLQLTFDRETTRFTSLSAPGLSATFAADSASLGLTLSDHQGLPLGDPRSEFVSDHAFEPGQGGPDTLRVVRDFSDAELRLEERWVAFADRIELFATIAHTGSSADGAPVSRGVEVCVDIPIPMAGRRWYHDLHHSDLIGDSGVHQTLLTSGRDIGAHYQYERNRHLQSRLPFNLHGVNLIADRTSGLAMAIHPDWPSAYYAQYDAAARRYSACFHIGIYGAHKVRPGRASFAVILFHPDQPAWGMRSALAKYTRMYPSAFRGAGDRIPGVVVGGEYRYRHYPEPGQFYVGAMWNGFVRDNVKKGVPSLLYAWPTGYVDRGMRLGKSPVGGECTGCDSSQEAHIKACMDIYRDFDAGQRLFRETCAGLWDASDCRPDSGRGPAKNYGPVSSRGQFYHLEPTRVVMPSHLPLRLFGVFDIHKPLANSLMLGADGAFLGRAQALFEIDRSSEPYTCYFNGLNPDPGVVVTGAPLPEAGAKPPAQTENFGHLGIEVARRSTGVYGDRYVFTDPRHGSMRYRGLAIDTVGAYLRPDFNPASLAVASLPLSYDEDTGRAVTLEHLSLSAYTREAQRALADDAVIAINGMPISGALGHGVDVFVRELGKRFRAEPGDSRPTVYDELYDEPIATRLRRVDRLRMVAIQRPITVWARFHRTAEKAAKQRVKPAEVLLADIRRYLPLYTAKGIYVYIQRIGVPATDLFFSHPQDPKVIAEYQSHLRLVDALTRAGWEHLPYVIPSEPALITERFGQNLITLYNTSDSEVTSDLRVLWQYIADSAPPTGARDLATGTALTARFKDRDKELIVSGLRLAGGAAMVIELTR
ncbi:MAG: hypothetical protein AAGC55_03550 [Myxococcota bacterium]